VLDKLQFEAYIKLIEIGRTGNDPTGSLLQLKYERLTGNVGEKLVNPVLLSKDIDIVAFGHVAGKDVI